MGGGQMARTLTAKQRVFIAAYMEDARQREGNGAHSRIRGQPGDGGIDRLEDMPRTAR